MKRGTGFDMRGFFLTSTTLLQRETVRFLRQKNRIIGTVGTPLVFWFLIGSGLGASFSAPSSSLSYLQYFFPGTILLVLLFTSIFSTISIIEDRREGFLQAVLVAPIPRSSLVMGKLLGGSLLALIQGVLFLALAPVLKFDLSGTSLAYCLALIFLVSFGLTGLGFMLAWWFDSTQGFHAIMNLFLMPLWLMSGSLFPYEGAPGWLQAVMTLNPLTYAVSGLQSGLVGAPPQAHAALSSQGICLAVCLAFSCVMFAGAVRVASQRSKR